MAKWCGALAVALSLFALAPPASTATDRTLSFFNTHTNETLTVTYKRDGRYIPAAMAQINHILRDWRRNEVVEMDPRLIDLVWEVYQRTGATQAIYIICGYRAPETNEMLRSRSNGVAQNSQHMNGNALDFFIPGVPLATLRNVGLQMQIGGVGYYPTSGSPFVHLDTGSVRHWPGISRQTLAQVFPDGRTLHIPSDGRPLPGYAEAQQAFAARGDTVVALFGQPIDDTGTGNGTRLAGLFGRNNAEPAAVAPAPTAAPVVVAAAAPTVIQAAPLPRPNRDPIPGVTVTGPAVADAGHDPADAIMAYAPTGTATGTAADAFAALGAPPPRPGLATAVTLTGAALGEAPGAPATAIPMVPALAFAGAWDNPVGQVIAPRLEGTILPLLDGSVTSRQAAFAQLSPPVTRNAVELLAAPGHVIQVAFQASGPIAGSTAFGGGLFRQVAVVALAAPLQAPATTLAAAR
ncbi:MAG: DUF882 domain-containing protein [Bauldia sp.]